MARACRLVAGIIAAYGRQWRGGWGGRLTDGMSLAALVALVPRDAAMIGCSGGQARGRSDGKLPPHVMAYFAMALALFADDDYEEVATRLTETLTSWGCWDDSWSVPGSGGITQARRAAGIRADEGAVPARVAAPVAEQLTPGRSWDRGG